VRRVRRVSVLPHVRKAWRLSERRACAILDVNRKALHYRSKKHDGSVLRLRIKELAAPDSLRVQADHGALAA
jgi:hypothetical protein